MSFEVSSGGSGTKLVLAGRLGVRQVRALWEAVQPAVAAGAMIRVEAEELEEMDTSIIQVLCRLSSQTGRLEVGAVSDGFLASLQRRGLETFFMQPSTLAEAPARHPGSRHV